MANGGWKVVRNNNQRRAHNRGSVWTDRRGKKSHLNDEVTSFFITEFPEELCAKHIFEIFKGYRLVAEVAIPPKRDKKERRYGFVRFRKMSNERDLATKLDNIFIRGRKLYANIPRFNRKKKVFVKAAYGGGDNMEKQTRFKQSNPISKASKFNDSRQGYITYSNVVMGKDEKWERIGGCVGTKRNGTVHERKTIGWDKMEKKPMFAHLQFNVESSDLKHFEKAYVGIVETPGMTFDIQEAFHSEGYFRVKATPLGANLCLLEEQEEGEIKALVEEAKDWISQWFSDIHPWSLEDVDNERITWLRCYGLPCHAWSTKFFEFLSGLVGTYVCSDDETRDHTRMDVARFMIRTKSSMVLNETFNLEVNKHVYGIKLVEDMHGPKRIVVPQASKKDDIAEVSSEEENKDDSGAWSSGDCMGSEEEKDK
ncbi:uncharacterized protein LOC131613953 [Vicia villosa]|uniref:uncharacterized protein LOC131613953 n=1 Tax=Vicia villosa TaxID=3911 RepID=UPI00273B3B4E|nr:uncharacterized protein LOC131613953 [Vicia villosa]